MKKYRRFTPLYKTVFFVVVTVLGILGSLCDVLEAVLDKEKTAPLRTAALWCVHNAGRIDTHVWLAVGILGLIFLGKVHISNSFGGKAGPFGWLRLFGLLNPRSYVRLIYDIHSFQHEFRKQLATIGSKNDPFSKKFSASVADLLRHVKNALDNILGPMADVSVSLKIFVPGADSQREAEEAYTSEAVLKTLARCRSRREQIAKTGGEQGRVNRDFKVTPISYSQFEDADIDNFKRLAISSGHSVNSAYNYCFGKTRHFWINNDLDKAERQRHYFSSSENYKNYYNSLAVILVNEPCEVEDALVVDGKAPLIGLLTVDSRSTGRFDDRIFSQVAGYFAHRLYSYLQMTTNGEPNA